MSQSRRRPPAKSQPKRRQATSNRNQRIYAILGIVVVVALIATVVGPPLVDYLTRQDDEPDIAVDEDDSADPNQTAYLDQIESDPNNYQAMAGLGNYLAQIGKIDEAIVWYERSFEIAPNDWQNRLSFARDLADADKRADAELQYKKVMAACPGSLQTTYSLGQLYARWVPAPRTAEAVQAFSYVVTFGGESFLVELAKEELSLLGIASPVAGSAAASPVLLLGSPVTFEEGCP